MAPGFVHLHNHTEYSMLDGAARVGDLAAEAARMGMPAIAMTDHGNLFGAYDFHRTAIAAGIKPIIGIEAYLAPGSRFDRTRVGIGGAADGAGDKYTHMTILARNQTGYHNLVKLASLASLEGFYYAPRMDRELLSQFSDGLIATSGCPSGEVNRLLQRGERAAARQALADYADIFGRGNFYVELMDHGLAIETGVRRDLVDLARELDLPLVATNDLHYTRPDDATGHAVLLCIQRGTTLDDPKRFKFDADEFYLKSAEQMRERWAELPEACDNTLAIAERIEGYDFSHRDLMPRCPVPDGETEASWLRAETDRGLAARFPAGVPDGHRQRAAYELGVIEQMGYPGYFLVVADLVRHAKDNAIRVGPGRGSAAGSVVSYALGICGLDPLEHGLIFERFLNPERVSMPDIDLDFDERRRGDMIRYATERYGEDRVAQIVTYGTIKAKQAVKDSARVLGYPFALGERITKAMPPAVMGKDVSLAGLFDAEHARYGEGKDFRDLYTSDNEVHRVVDTARDLEGLKRQWGVHAAGVILCREPLTDVIPVQRREADGAIITQFDMGACESLGLLKMDFLGLRTLTVLDDAIANIEANRGEHIVLEELPLGDAATYDLLALGETLGVFQLDGGPMRALLRSLKPTGFGDIVAVNALYRPGPMGANAHNDYADRKNARKPVAPIHPELAEPLADILDETYGVLVYQEQVIAIAQRVAGYSVGKADLLRKAMGKKKKEVLDREYEPFAAGMRERGYSEHCVETLWQILVPFADYAFNKAHATGYGLVGYWTAYLKANYPAEYMAALLTSLAGDKDKSAVYLHECRRMGIKVLPPCVNASDADFTPTGTDIRFGLSAIRNVGRNVVTSILGTRRATGRFADFADFLRAVEPVVCNRKVVESLIKAGAFDALGQTRRGLLQVHGEALETVLSTKRAEAVGQYDLFSSADDAAGSTGSRPEIAVPVGEWDKPVLLGFEREMLGLYVSDHPLFGVEHVLAAAVDVSIGALAEEADGRVRTVGGIVADVTHKTTKQGKRWATATLEDLDGSVELLVFPATYEQYAVQLAADALLVVRGRVDRREASAKVIAMEITTLNVTDAPRGPVAITMPASRCSPPVVERLKEVLSTHPGTTEVHLHLQSGTAMKVLRLDDAFRVRPSPALLGDLKALLGPGSVSW